MRYQRLKNKPVIVIDADNIEAAKKLIPSAQLVDVQGTQCIAVKHDVDTVRVLRNIGLMVPSPIGYDYEWAGNFTPFNHQIKTAEFLTLHRRCFVLNEIGTGKSLSALWAADFLFQEGAVDKVLILSPLSTLERVWGDEIFRHFPQHEFAVLHGTAAKRKELLADPRYRFYIINHDGLPIIYNELLKRDDINLVVADESAVYRNYRTDRYKLFAKFVKARPDLRLWLMTGTPTPNAPTDAWAQCKLVNPDSVSPYFSRFRDMVMTQLTQFKWVAKKDSADILKHLMQPAIRFTRDECFDLPPTTYQTHETTLTPPQEKAYMQMLRLQYTELESGSVTAANEAVKSMKLIQIACGAIYDDEGNVSFIDASPRINLLKEVIEQAGGKVIVFVPLRSVLRMLTEKLSTQYTVATVHGGTAPNARNKIFTAFQKSPSPQILVAHPRCMSHGLTLTAASTIVWYAPYPSNDIYGQANGRITRPGQERHTTIVHIAATNMELNLYKRLESRKKLQGVLLDEIKRMMS